LRSPQWPIIITLWSGSITNGRRTHVEGVESADHPTDGELLDFARRYVKAADRMRP
jgi:hypothetical protein